MQSSVESYMYSLAQLHSRTWHCLKSMPSLPMLVQTRTLSWPSLKRRTTWRWSYRRHAESSGQIEAVRVLENAI
jgi:hypothetical protein